MVTAGFQVPGKNLLKVGAGWARARPAQPGSDPASPPPLSTQDENIMSSMQLFENVI